MVMARLLRNRLESYVNNVNRAEADYSAQAATYNKALTGAMGGTTSVITDDTGKQVVVGGKTETGQLALKAGNIGSTAPSGEASDMDMVLGGSTIYAKDAQGNVRPYHIMGTSWVEGVPLPVIPETPEVDVPQQPNLTQSNIKELQSPSYDPAGVVAQGNYGINAKSQLAGEVANSKVSAFADPEDPNDAASRGILARTLAGQLG